MISLDIHLAEYTPLNGSSYMELPKFIKIKNVDNQCFKWSITRVLNLVEKESQRITILLRAQSEHLN